ncbi:MAG TPA: enoyl-CoA hydratase/isomerase family protein [Roseomonas sp.]
MSIGAPTFFDNYVARHPHVAMERRNGILQMTLHSNGGPFHYDLQSRDDVVAALSDVAQDPDNRVVIITGTGAEFTGPRSDPHQNVFALSGVPLTPSALDRSGRVQVRLLQGLLAVEVPMIAAVNGPTKRHSEIALMCDIVLTAEEATFEDTAHFHLGSHVPGDGINIVLSLLLGLNRARYMMLTGQVLSASEAKQLGLAAEVLPRDQLLSRAWALAEQLAQKPDLVLRYTRAVLTHPLRKAIGESLEHHLALERLAVLDSHGSPQSC